MITSNKLLISAAFSATLILAGTASAQVQAGLLGQRYLGVSAFTESLRHRDISNGTGAELAVNVPIASHFDFGINGSYEKFSDYCIEDKRVFGTLRGWYDLQGVRPFADVAIGNTWQSSKVGSWSYSSSDGLWAAGAGLELPVADATALYGRIAYQKYFKSENGHYWTYTVGLNHWFTERIGAQASVLFWENESILYSVGVTVRF